MERTSAGHYTYITKKFFLFQPMESSLVMGVQRSWTSWVSLTYQLRLMEVMNRMTL